MVRRFFFDMDGVMAKFEPASLEEMTTAGFFASREPVDSVIRTVKLMSAKRDTEVYVLSSVLLDISKREKIQWNAEYTGIPERNQIYVPYGTEKEKMLDCIGGIRPTDVLVDDYTRNLNEWSGIGVKLYNGINGTHGTWKGFSIHSSMWPEYMACQLDAISAAASRSIEKEIGQSAGNSVRAPVRMARR